MIALEPQHESLRETLFYNIFKRSIMFDNLETALAYRRSLVTRNVSPPTIYTRRGDKLNSDGVLNPRQGAGKLPDALEFVFGQLPAPVEGTVAGARGVIVLRLCIAMRANIVILLIIYVYDLCIASQSAASWSEREICSRTAIPH